MHAKVDIKRYTLSLVYFVIGALERARSLFTMHYIIVVEETRRANG